MYKVLESKIELEGKEEIVYSLQHEDGTTINNVSPNRAEAERLADYYTKAGLSPIHLKEVVSDMIDTPDGLNTMFFTEI